MFDKLEQVLSVCASCLLIAEPELKPLLESMLGDIPYTVIGSEIKSLYRNKCYNGLFINYNINAERQDQYHIIKRYFGSVIILNDDTYRIIKERRYISGLPQSGKIDYRLGKLKILGV
jgi:hypothetical protein